MLLSSGVSGGGAVAITVVVGGVLSAGVSAVQHYRLCWPHFQCETDPSMYPFSVVSNRLCVAHFKCLFVAFFVYLFCQ